MNKLMFSLVAIAASVELAAIADDAAKPKLTREQVEERRNKALGGYIIQPVETRIVSIVSDPGAIDPAVLNDVADDIQRMLRIPVKVGGTDNVGLTLEVSAGDGKEPLVVMPDNARARVNVKALASDGPSAAVLGTRVKKELWRGLIYALGGGNTFVPGCVMKQVTSLSDLDKLACTASPDAFNCAMEGASKLGMKQMRRVSYRKACVEGWAPAPTNEYQKVIWEKCKAEANERPTNPLKIVKPAR